MVWHAYQLNPRNFLEDCLRFGKMAFWRTGLPWSAINACIDNTTFEFKPDQQAVKDFKTATGLAWKDAGGPVPNKTLITCPRCHKALKVPWTTWDRKEMWQVCNDRFHGEIAADGIADKCFRYACKECHLVITHDTLKVHKFQEDINLLKTELWPMPGTVLSIDGTPDQSSDLDRFPTNFPNRLIGSCDKRISHIHAKLTGLCDPRYCPQATMNDIKKGIEDSLKVRSWVAVANITSSGRAPRESRVAIRRMMSSYWDNGSPFALDLAGAVIRQSSFIEKMHSIDWLHSPACSSTMSRLIQKYTRYIQIIGKYPSQVAVPTLDVDLAWHTHQLSPLSYYTYTTRQCSQRFIDHDDKIDDVKLSTAFEWTSKTYQKMFSELYSECTCWYCEAVRESHTSSIKRVFSSNAAIDHQLDRLDTSTAGGHHSGQEGPHISTHNAIKPSTVISHSKREAAHRQRLEANYSRACTHARKRGRPVPDRADYYNNYTYMAYGYPLIVPYYAPYMGDPCTTASMYAANPSCATFVPGAAGNCAAGSCGGGVAAGACAGGGAGGCAGSSAGGCGGGGSGGCGGGGGGCGGGGGGCGGGGGG